MLLNFEDAAELGSHINLFRMWQCDRISQFSAQIIHFPHLFLSLCHFYYNCLVPHFLFFFICLFINTKYIHVHVYFIHRTKQICICIGTLEAGTRNTQDPEKPWISRAGKKAYPFQGASLTVGMETKSYQSLRHSVLDFRSRGARVIVLVSLCLRSMAESEFCVGKSSI